MAQPFATIGDVLRVKTPERLEDAMKHSRRNRGTKKPAGVMPRAGQNGKRSEKIVPILPPFNLAGQNQDVQSETPETDDDDRRPTTLYPNALRQETPEPLSAPPDNAGLDAAAERVERDSMLAENGGVNDGAPAMATQEPQPAVPAFAPKPPSVPPPPVSQRVPAGSRDPDTNRITFPQLPPPPVSTPKPVPVPEPRTSDSPTMDEENVIERLTGLSPNQLSEQEKGAYAYPNEALRSFLNAEHTQHLTDQRCVIACELLQREGVAPKALTVDELRYFLQRSDQLRWQPDIKRRGAMERLKPLVADELQEREARNKRLAEASSPPAVPPAPNHEAHAETATAPMTQQNAVATPAAGAANTPAPPQGNHGGTWHRFRQWLKRSARDDRPRPPRKPMGPGGRIVLLILSIVAISGSIYLLLPSLPILQQRVADWVAQKSTPAEKPMDAGEAVVEALKMLGHTDACVLLPPDFRVYTSTEDAHAVVSCDMRRVQITDTPGAPPQQATAACHCKPVQH